MKAILIAALLFLTACSQNLSSYSGSTEPLDLQSFFNGELKAWGVVTSRNGTVKRRFTATIDASWQGNIGTLDEVFWFDDGEVQTRIWKITKEGNSYHGTANDVVGVAHGSSEGMAMNWHYTLAIPIDGTDWEFTVKDWLYLIDDTVLMNTGSLSKFGIELGTILLFIQKQQAPN